MWENLDNIPVLRGPKTVLQEYAEAFNDKMSGFGLRAQVNVATFSDGDIGEEFIITIPRRNKYRTELFDVKHALVGYPAQVRWMEQKIWNREEVQDEHELREVVSRIANSDEVARIIGALKAYAE